MTLLLLALNIAVFGLEVLGGDAVLRRYALWPLGHGFALPQLLTGAFLHGSLMHLGANMFGLWMFGRDVERALGARRYLLLYFVSLLLASLTQLAIAALAQWKEPTVGASGALFGLLAAYAMLFPRRVLMPLFPPIPLPAPVFVVLYAAFELYAGVTGTQAGVAHFAHLGGLFGGVILMLHWRRHADAELRYR